MPARLLTVGHGTLDQDALGGRRRPSPTSPSVALRNEAFRGYADWMATAAFRTALDGVMRAARADTTAMMCAETVWWHCHRRLIADAAILLHAGAVEHLFHDGRLRPHAVTDGARRSGDEVVYDRLSPATPAGAPPPAAPGRPRPTPRGAPGRQEPLPW